MSGTNSTTSISESSSSSLSPTPISTTSSIISSSSSVIISTTTSSTTSSLTPSTTSSTTTPTPTVIVSVITKTPTVSGEPTSTIFVTSTHTPDSVTSQSSGTTSSTSTSSTAGLVPSGGSGAGGGLTGGGKIAVATVVPIVAVALLVLAGLFLWRKRKQRKDAEELRRKEVEEYGYNPNADPTLPAVGGVAAGGGNDGSYEMREDGSSGYRGWGTTAVASSGRKPSTTMSGPSAGGIGMAYSDTTPNHEAISENRSDSNVIDGRPLSQEAEALGALGPSASQNRGGDINRGPSNASSSYSAAGRSDASGEAAGYGAAAYNQYDTGNPYAETPYGSPPNRAEMPAQPVIRDVQARRNTRIENPSHFPQQSSGISQNF